MKYLNQFHKEAVERKLRKIAESMKSPMNSLDAANYMKRNFEMAKSMWLLNTGSILRLLERICWHNNIFYDTAYAFYAFTGFDGRSVMPIFSQKLVKNAIPATQIEIETYMAAIGFTKLSNDGRFSNGEYEAWDLVPRNVLKDKEGDIFIIDAEIKILHQ